MISIHDSSVMLQRPFHQFYWNFFFRKACWSLFYMFSLYFPLDTRATLASSFVAIRLKFMDITKNNNKNIFHRYWNLWVCFCIKSTCFLWNFWYIRIVWRNIYEHKDIFMCHLRTFEERNKFLVIVSKDKWTMKNLSPKSDNNNKRGAKLW